MDVGPAMYGASQANKRSQALLDSVRQRLLAASLKNSGGRKSSGVGDAGGAGDSLAKLGSSGGGNGDGMSDGDMSDDEENELINEARDPPAKEHHFHRLGGVGILFVDMRGGRMLERGGQALDNPIVSQEQWQHIEHALSDSDGSMRVLLVCAERPLVEETPASSRIRSRRPETFAVKRWAYNDHELERLLICLWHGSLQVLIVRCRYSVVDFIG